MSTPSNNTRRHVRTSQLYYGLISSALFPKLPRRPRRPRAVQKYVENAHRVLFQSKYTRSRHAVRPVRDLIANSILMWLVPNNVTCHYVKFVSVFAALLVGWVIGILHTQEGHLVTTAVTGLVVMALGLLL